MKKVIVVLVLVIGFAFNSNAQDVKKISLEQTKGEFVQKGLTISEGTYVFDIINSNVGKDVGFVLVPKGKSVTDANNHIKNAYVTAVVENNTIGNTKEVTLTKGEYVYFCPLNKTPQYTLTVE